MQKVIDGELLTVPEHVAIILDGNGRWAKKRLLPRNYGHKQGAKTVEQICEDAWNLGIKYLTVYAFSTENWKRPQNEVDALMKLLRNYLVDCIKRTSKNNMRVRVIGDKTGLSEDIRASIEELERVSSVNTGLNFTIAINYGSRDEMRRAMVHLAQEVEDGKGRSEDITEELFACAQMVSELDAKMLSLNEEVQELVIRQKMGKTAEQAREEETSEKAASE